MHEMFKEESEKNGFPIVPISCETKENVEFLLEVVGEVAAAVMDKSL